MSINEFLQEILDWSEVWATLIPLGMWWKHRKQPKYLAPVIVYLLLALLIDLLIDVKWKFEKYMPLWYRDNNFLYNVHSVVRFVCFVPFFNRLLPKTALLTKILPAFSLVFLIVNFYQFENFFQPNKFSSRLLATEAGLLLFYCLRYYLYRLQDENVPQKPTPDFWIVLGLSFYVVINFFIFLFWGSLIDNGKTDVANALWNIHNAAFIFFCVFIAKGFQTVEKREQAPLAST
jgi:hypothetical protein